MPWNTSVIQSHKMPQAPPPFLLNQWNLIALMHNDGLICTVTSFLDENANRNRSRRYISVVFVMSVS